MKHIITVHHKTNKWIDLQVKQIGKHISNCKVWSYCDGFDILPHRHKFDFCENSNIDIMNGSSLNHMAKLNSLTDIVLKSKDVNENDLLIWLDSDAFPIKDLDEYISKKMSRYNFIAINRPENGGDRIPHPSFTCSTVSFWKKHNLNWNGLPDIKKHGLNDTGGYIYKVLTSKNIEWYKLLRTSSLTKHEVFFTIYDNLIYHHGAGTRHRGRTSGDCRGGDFGATYNQKEIFKMVKEKIEKETFNI